MAAITQQVRRGIHSPSIPDREFNWGSCQVLGQLGGAATHEFQKVRRLYENEGWWREINSSSLPAIPVSRENPSLDCSLVLIPRLDVSRRPDPVVDIHRGGPSL